MHSTHYTCIYLLTVVVLLLLVVSTLDSLVEGLSLSVNPIDTESVILLTIAHFGTLTGGFLSEWPQFRGFKGL